MKNLNIIEINYLIFIKLNNKMKNLILHKPSIDTNFHTLKETPKSAKHTQKKVPEFENEYFHHPIINSYTDKTKKNKPLIKYSNTLQSERENTSSYSQDFVKDYLASTKTSMRIKDSFKPSYEYNTLTHFKRSKTNKKKLLHLRSETQESVKQRNNTENAKKKTGYKLLKTEPVNLQHFWKYLQKDFEFGSMPVYLHNSKRNVEKYDRLASNLQKQQRDKLRHEHEVFKRKYGRLLYIPPSSDEEEASSDVSPEKSKPVISKLKLQKNFHHMISLTEGCERPVTLVPKRLYKRIDSITNDANLLNDSIKLRVRKETKKDKAMAGYMEEMDSDIQKLKEGLGYPRYIKQKFTKDTIRKFTMLTGKFMGGAGVK
jgi:hypothetical protein